MTARRKGTVRLRLRACPERANRASSRRVQGRRFNGLSQRHELSEGRRDRRPVGDKGQWPEKMTANRGLATSCVAAMAPSTSGLPMTSSCAWPNTIRDKHPSTRRAADRSGWFGASASRTSSRLEGGRSSLRVGADGRRRICSSGTLRPHLPFGLRACPEGASAASPERVQGRRFNGRPPVSKTGCGGSNPSAPACSERVPKSIGTRRGTSAPRPGYR